MSFLQTVQKKIQNPNSSIVADGIIGDLSGFIDTGSYVLNALISGSIFNGFPDNKITVLAGPEATGKSFILLTAISNFLQTFKRGFVVFFESESAQNKNQMELLGIDTSRILFVPIITVQEFRTNLLQILEEYKALKREVREEERLMLCLDSLGNLSTTKEMEDSSAGKETADMTRAKLIKSTFRTVTLKLGILSVPLICTNHVYQSQGLFATTEMGGGCLVKGTLIKDKHFNDIPIDDVIEDTYVQTMLGQAKVKKVWTPDNLQNPYPKCVQVTLENGDSVSCSLNHRFWCNRQWKKIKDCKIGDLLTGFIDYETVVFHKIISILPIGKQPVYDIHVDTFEHYILTCGNLLSHNSGPKFNASTVVYLSKKKEKEGTDIIGNVVHALINKSRFTREGAKIDTLINFSKGLDRYYGLLEVGISCGLIQEKGYRFLFPNGELGFKKDIRNDPQRFFTHDLLLDLDKILGAKFKFGEEEINSEEDEETT